MAPEQSGYADIKRGRKRRVQVDHDERLNEFIEKLSAQCEEEKSPVDPGQEDSLSVERTKVTSSQLQRAALEYRERFGFTTIPIIAEGDRKKPRFAEWKEKAPKSDAEITSAFSAEGNIAVICGAASGNLIDIDVDDEDAHRLAPQFLPKTDFVYGRSGTPMGHWMYRSADVPPPYKKLSHEKKCLVEFRSTDGQYTVLPPSVHETGEVYSFAVPPKDREAIPVVDAADLLKKVYRLAAATVLLKVYPREPGFRHDAALALGGGLARLGWSCEEAQGFLAAVAEAAGDEEREDRVQAVADAFQRLAKGKPVAGFPKFRELFGDEAAKHLGAFEKFLRAGAEQPTITIQHDIRLMQEDLEALLASEDGLYQHGGRLVRLVKGDNGQHRIQELAKATLLALASRYRWMAERQSEDGKTRRVREKPPLPVIDAFLAEGHWKLPVLRGVTHVPTLLKEGILDQPGYHAGSGLFYSPSIDFDPVRTSLSQEDAAKLVQEIIEPFSDLPFLDEKADRAALLGMIFTQVLRRSIDGPVPLLMVRAPDAGTGKGLVVDTISILATGLPATCQSWPQNHEDEVRKTLLTIVREGAPLVCFDNMTGVLRSNALCTYLTSRTYGGRLLSTMTAAQAPAEVVIFATGNNITPVGDMLRRVVCLDLDAKMARPESRQGFKKADLRAYIREHRKSLVPAVLSVVLAYQRDGQPKQPCPAVGSYEAWTAMVRQPLIWAGAGDPGQKLIDARKEGDDEEALKIALLLAWREHFGSQEVTSKEVLNTDDGALKKALVNVMREAELHPTAGTIVGVKPLDVGNFLGSFKGRIFDLKTDEATTDEATKPPAGLRLAAGHRGNAGTKWKVEFVDEKGEPLDRPVLDHQELRRSVPEQDGLF